MKERSTAMSVQPYTYCAYPFDRLLANPTLFQPGNPPFMPGNLSVHPSIAQHVPFICSEVATVVSRNAQRSPAHVYHFNQISRSGYQNPDYVTLVQTACDYMFIGLNRGLYSSAPNISYVIQDTVEQVVKFGVAIIINSIQEIQQVMPPQAIQQAREVQNQIYSVQQEIKNLRMQMMQQQNQPMMPQGYQPQNLMQPQQQYVPNYARTAMNPNQGAFFGQQPAQQHYMQQQFQPQQYAQPAPTQGVFGGGVFSSQNRPQQQTMQNTASPGSSRYSYLHRDQIPPKQPEQPYQAFHQFPQNQQYPQKEIPPAPPPVAAPPAPPPAIQPMPVPHNGPHHSYLKNGPNAQQEDQIYFDFTGTKVAEGWRATPEQPYIPAVHSEKEVRIYVRKASTTDPNSSQVMCYVGDINAYPQITKEDMERNKHYVSPVSKHLLEARALARKINLNDEAEIMKNVTSDPVANKPTIAQPEVNEPIAKALSDLKETINVDTTSLSNALTTAKIHQKFNKDLKAVRISTEIDKSFVCDQDYTKVLLNLSGCETFVHLAAEMRKIFESSGSSENLKELIACLDRRLRQRLLHVMRYRLGVSNVEFDSFMYDVPHLFNFLKQNNGESFSAALINAQEKLIKTYLVGTPYLLDLAVKDENGSEEEKETDSKDTTPKVIGLTEKITVTYVDFLAEQLRMNVTQNMSNMVSVKTHPELNKLIQETVHLKSEDVGYGSHYLVTADDLVFEMHEGLLGYLNNRSYLVNEVIV